MGGCTLWPTSFHFPCFQTPCNYNSILWVQLFRFHIKWYHTVFVFLWLISICIMYSRPTNFAANGKILSSWWVNNIPLCIYNTFLPIHPLADTWVASILLYRKSATEIQDTVMSQLIRSNLLHATQTEVFIPNLWVKS